MKSSLALILLFFIASSYSQENQNSNGVEDILSAKAGFLGAWLSYEKAIAENISLNGEIGYEGGLTGGNSDLDFILTTTFSVESRYYYNLLNRIEKGKNTNNNAGNYLALDLIYTPDLLTSSDKGNIDVVENFSILPKWGLRRSLSTKLFFEFALGVGYSWGEYDNNNATAGLDLRVGYAF